MYLIPWSRSDESVGIRWEVPNYGKPLTFGSVLPHEIDVRVVQIAIEILHPLPGDRDDRHVFHHASVAEIYPFLHFEIYKRRIKFRLIYGF